MPASFRLSNGQNVRIEQKNGAKIVSTNLWGSFYLITDRNAVNRLIALMNSDASVGEPAYIAVKELFDVNEIGIPDPARGGSFVASVPVTKPVQTVANPAPQPSSPISNIVANNPAPSISHIAPEMNDYPFTPVEEPAPVANDSQNENAFRQTKISIAERLLKLLCKDEFVVTPSARFVNTIARSAWNGGLNEAKSYFKRYFELSDHPDKDRINPLADSMEFESIVNDMLTVPLSKQINNRLEIYYGAPGTGKTTEAKKLYPNAKVMICSKEMTSDNLFRRFEFNDVNGNPVFRQTALVDAMEAGEPIIMDEINLLPWSSIQDLQSLTDNKEEPYIEALKKAVKVKPGFKIIGTMNLQINGQTYGLSEALVDRAGVLKEFKMEADQLADWAW